MTSKELFYVEDALEHEQYFQTRCNEIAGQIQNTELRNSAIEMQQKHQQIFNSFINLLD